MALLWIPSRGLLADGLIPVLIWVLKGVLFFFSPCQLMRGLYDILSNQVEELTIPLHASLNVIAILLITFHAYVVNSGAYCKRHL